MPSRKRILFKYSFRTAWVSLIRFSILLNIIGLYNNSNLKPSVVKNKLIVTIKVHQIITNKKSRLLGNCNFFLLTGNYFIIK